jgi:hypothetical protein
MKLMILMDYHLLIKEKEFNMLLAGDVEGVFESRNR